MDFTELLAMLTNPGEDGVPDTIYDDLSASYTDATSTRDAKIAETSTAYDALVLELQAAKAMNYDLMLSQVADSGESDENESDSDSEDNDTPPDSDTDDDSDFFETKD